MIPQLFRDSIFQTLEPAGTDPQTGNNHLIKMQMCIHTMCMMTVSFAYLREYKGKKISWQYSTSVIREKTAWMQEEGIFRNLVNGEIIEVKDPVLKGYDFVWMK